ncbi:MAG: hypothetical protein R2709_13070 [Marmoricola sp.]
MPAWLAAARANSRLKRCCRYTVHYDHGLDSAVVAQKLGSALVGGSSTAQLGLGVGLSRYSRLSSPMKGVSQEFGPWKITLIEADHCPLIAIG